MFHHTNQFHNGVIGTNRGEDDYFFVLTGTFQNNLERLENKGRRRTLMEMYQSQKKVGVLNCKIDFIKPMRTKLVAIGKAANVKLEVLNRSP